MTDILLSSFLSLFALFGKEEEVDEAWAKSMLTSYMHRYLGIRNIEPYLALYSDMRNVYEMTEDLNSFESVENICSTLHGKISPKEEALLVLRLMEFCGGDGQYSDFLFRAMTEKFNISDLLYDVFKDFVDGSISFRIFHSLL